MLFDSFVATRKFIIGQTPDLEVTIFSDIAVEGEAERFQTIQPDRRVGLALIPDDLFVKLTKALVDDAARREDPNLSRPPPEGEVADFVRDLVNASV